MILYNPKSLGILIQRRGSVVPQAARIAFSTAIVSCILEWIQGEQLRGRLSFLPVTIPSGNGDWMIEPIIWGGLMSMVTFFLIFRTSIAYGRFWDGATSTMSMSSEWYDACSSLCAFTRYSKADPVAISRFKHLIVRLFSALHALALAEIEDGPHTETGSRSLGMELIDIQGLDEMTLRSLHSTDQRTQLVLHWLQGAITDALTAGILNIPPPLLTRVFQELSNGLMAFNQALKVADIPFPFPYAQICSIVLCFIWIATPVVVTHWVDSVQLSAVCSFTQVFVLYAINSIAGELENPFGDDENDLCFVDMQKRMNSNLVLLLSDQATVSPTLSSKANVTNLGNCLAYDQKKDSKYAVQSSFASVWHSRNKGPTDKSAVKVDDELYVEGDDDSEIVSNGFFRSTVHDDSCGSQGEDEKSGEACTWQQPIAVAAGEPPSPGSGVEAPMSVALPSELRKETAQFVASPMSQAGDSSEAMSNGTPESFSRWRHEKLREASLRPHIVPDVEAARGPTYLRIEEDAAFFEEECRRPSEAGQLPSIAPNIRKAREAHHCYLPVEAGADYLSQVECLSPRRRFEVRPA